MKEQIHQACLERISKEIEELNQAILALREGLSNDTKSSAGDKFETSRAMADHEMSKLESQLFRLNSHLNTLTKMDTTQQHAVVSMGSLVITDKQLFYISVAMGKMALIHKEVMVISTQSPIFAAMEGKVAGSPFSFGQTTYSIQKVC